MAGHSKPQGIMTLVFAFFTLLQATAALHGAHHQYKHSLHSRDALESHFEETANLLQKRANNIAITGVCNSGTNNVGVCNTNGRTSAPRLEIRELKKNADQWNLYLLGMERFQAKSKSDRLSYYQIAGVHGVPFVTWNNFPTPLTNRAGFCPHAQSLFGSWHRPYLAVFEQALYQSIQEVIATFPSGQQQRWRNAASTFRMPYWDWATVALGGPNVPAEITTQRVTVTKPSGQVTINNPLYSYTWGNSLPAEIGSGPYNSFATTLRRPISNPTRSNDRELNSRFGAIRNELRDRVYSLFASKQSWGYASTSQIGVQVRDNLGSRTDSFESIHDLIHVTAGGESGGHMYFLDYSSFDPIFWLHHTNVDRLLAMYQLIVPNSYVANGNINRPMAQWNQGEGKNGNSPLKPFTKDTSGNYFTSGDVRETRTLGYFYPETRDRTASQVSQAVTSLYGNGKRLSKRDPATGRHLGRRFEEGDYNTVLSVVADKYALSGSYVVHCFVGKPGSNSTAPYPTTNSTGAYTNSTDSYTGDFTEDPNYVGAHGVLGGTMKGGNASYPVMTEGCIPLTTALQGKQADGEIKSLHPDDVKDYLKDNLYCKVIGPDGKELGEDDLPDYHITVKSCAVTPPSSDDELPSYGEYVDIPDVTKHLLGGKPFKYVPSPFDIPLPEGSDYNEHPSPSEEPQSYPTGVLPYPTLPWEEEGYCATKQTIEYVDEAGNFLYAESS